jgi:hypothetical protein
VHAHHTAHAVGDDGCAVIQVIQQAQVVVTRKAKV